MCPDKETLSAFIDNEVEGVFKDILDNHILSCGKCRKEINALKSVKSLFNSTESMISENDIEISGGKVWKNIQNDIASRKKPDIWHRRITVPVPVLAAAAAVILVFTISTIINFYIFTESRNESRFNFSEVVIINHEEDFKLFERDQILDVDLNLPENTVFRISGTPKLIREVDYHNTIK